MRNMFDDLGRVIGFYVFCAIALGFLLGYVVFG